MREIHASFLSTPRRMWRKAFFSPRSNDGTDYAKEIFHEAAFSHRYSTSTTESVMNKSITSLFACLFACAGMSAAESKLAPAALSFREIRYEGRLGDDEARFTLDIYAEATSQGESSAQLLEGDVAILPGKLPDQLKIVREGNRYV